MFAKLAQAKVLVVDDFQGMRTVLRDLVRAMGVQRVDTAANGKDALQKLKASRYDVVVCDYNLGAGLNGQQVLDEARLHDWIGLSTIWVMVTAEKTPEMVTGVAEAKPDEYLLKPINQGMLQGRLERLLVKKQTLRKVEESLRAKDYASALQHCDALLHAAAAPSAELLRIKSELLLKLGDYPAARALFDAVLAQRDLPWARTGLGRLYFLQGQYELARGMFWQVLEDNPMFMEASDWQAKTFQALGDGMQAQLVLQDAARRSPNVVRRQKELGDVAYRNGELAVARAALEKTIKISEFSTNKQPEAYVALARVMSDSRQGDAALKWLQHTLKVFKDDPDVAVQVAAVQSVVHQQAGQIEAADKALAQAQALQERRQGRASARTTLELAASLLTLGRKSQAVDMLRQLVRTHHEDGQLSRQAQQLFERAGMGEEGRALMNEAREELIHINNQGVTLGRQGQFAEAARLLRMALQDLPGNEVMLLNLCGLLIAQMRAEGRSDALLGETMGLLRRVRELNPDSAKYSVYMNALKTDQAA